MLNVETVVELENYDFVSIIVKIGSSKNHQWIINVLSVRDNLYKEKDIYVSLKSLGCWLVTIEYRCWTAH